MKSSSAKRTNPFMAYSFRQFKVSSTRRDPAVDVPLQLNTTAESYLPKWESSSYPYWLARESLEANDITDKSGGCWGLNYHRMSAAFGDMGRRKFSDIDRPRSISSKKRTFAKSFAAPVYGRLDSPVLIMASLAADLITRIGVEVGTEWYDPPNGYIRASSQAARLSSHAVQLTSFDASRNLFEFRNSWGGNWGDNGWGKLSLSWLEKTVVESYADIPGGFRLPVKNLKGMNCVEWIWKPFLGYTLHVREIRSGLTKLGWAFFRVLHNRVQVDELFVVPTFRRRGVSKLLAEKILEFASERSCQIELSIPFADLDPLNTDGVDAVVKMFSLEQFDSASRFAATWAAKQPPRGKPVWRQPPQKPATPLELLRPKDEPAIASAHLYEIYYGTDRREEARPRGVRYSNSRGRKLHLGKATINVPKTHRIGSTGRFFLKRWLQGIDDRLRVVDTQSMSVTQFREDFDHRRQECEPKAKHLLFIHGFWNSFESGCLRAAQLGFDLKVSGQTFYFSWPSAGRALRYTYDQATVQAALPHFESFMSVVLAAVREETLCIVAHSMGNRLLCSWIASNRKVLSRKIENVVFTAADVDTDVFIQQTSELARATDRATIYTSQGDIPLALSKYVNGQSRIGKSPPVFVGSGIDTVDVRGLDLFSLGHDYFGTARDLLHDMNLLFQYSQPATKRLNLRPAVNHKGLIYSVLDL